MTGAVRRGDAVAACGLSVQDAESWRKVSARRRRRLRRAGGVKSVEARQRRQEWTCVRARLCVCQQVSAWRVPSDFHSTHKVMPNVRPHSLSCGRSPSPSGPIFPLRCPISTGEPSTESSASATGSFGSSMHLKSIFPTKVRRTQRTAGDLGASRLAMSTEVMPQFGDGV